VVKGIPLPLHAYFWRRRSIAELRQLERSLKDHRDDILRLQDQLTRRVSGIEGAMSFLGQAIDMLRTTPDASEVATRASRQPGYVPPLRRGRPRRDAAGRFSTAAE
jgi:hypothetical protein